MSSLAPASRRLFRLVVVPICLFVLFAGAAFALAKLHLAKPGTAGASGAAKLKLGDPHRGEALFTQRPAPAATGAVALAAADRGSRARGCRSRRRRGRSTTGAA